MTKDAEKILDKVATTVETSQGTVAAAVDGKKAKLNHSCLVRMKIVNIGCIGSEGLTVDLDKIICLVGPNNTGKSTVLKAYEKAVRNEELLSEEINIAARGPASVEIWVHMPKGVANVDEKWKVEEDGYSLVRSKWEWNGTGKPVRSTWDPTAKGYALDDRASGLDTVFSSRLPQPLRIHALQTPDGEHGTLLKLVLDPIAKEIEKLLKNEESELNKAMADVKSKAAQPVVAFSKTVERTSDRISESYRRVFPKGEVKLKVGLANFNVNPIDMLVKGSSLIVTEKLGGEDAHIGWAQQGTGAQRTLFWSMLEARSELKKAADALDLVKRRKASLVSDIRKLTKEMESAKKGETKAAKKELLDQMNADLEALEKPQEGITETDGILPSYMLLLDEPEIALHPSAVRAAQAYLYELAGEDSGWQVMISTHHPAFVNPLADHTTIVRLTRSDDEPTPRTYRSDSVEFATDEVENLKLLLRFDQTLAEMFFGGYPIIVEGDTEYAAFQKLWELRPKVYPIEERPLIIRARGKDTIALIVRILTQFKVSFSVLHDADSPLTAKGKRNIAWGANMRIYAAVQAAKKAGLRVVHRVSVVDFERSHALPKSGRNKPFKLWDAMKAKSATVESIGRVYADLTSSTANDEPFGDKFETGLVRAVMEWAKKSAPSNKQFDFATYAALIKEPEEEEE